MSKRAVLEVIALDAEDAVAAQAGGADRLELVTDMAADGLTPPVETFAKIRASVDISLRVMLRLQDGFSAGSPEEVDVLVECVDTMRVEGADEFVLGFLDSAGNVDLVTVERLVAELDPAAGRSTARSTARPTATRCASSSRTCPAWTRISRRVRRTGSTPASRSCWPRRSPRPSANRVTAPNSSSAAACGWTTCPGSARAV